MDHAGAIASNAGDDFHLIWTAKKCIEMLKADSKLNTMVVEGPAWEDSIQIQDQTQLLSIDLTEYYGGNSFESADSVVFSQLKYSAYNLEKEWNVSRMCSSSNNKKSNSVIRRMADTYKGFAEVHRDISNKVILKLVSNQHVSVDLLESVNECKNILLKHNYKRTADLLNQLSEEKRVIIEKLYSTTNLKSGLFIGFIKVLDLNNCGTSARDIHETEIMQQIGIWGFNNTKSSYNDLIMAIRKCMLPEGENTRINRNWIKAKLGVEEYNIFPAPDKIDPLQGKYIVKSGESDIVEAILSSTKKWICLHAIAGAGKTSFVRKLKMHLPMESVTVFYDCYGGGTFLQPYQARHKKEIAIRQICNTLASECKTELLLGSYNEDYLWWNAIKERLEQASRVVKDNNPEAVVAIIIDAADNSISASQLRHEECFLEKFLEMELPENIRIIVTARTERISSLPYIEQAEVLPIPLFSKENSAEHLREKYVCADDNTCCEFHQLTKGNPRLQSYVLSSAALLDDVLDIIRPNGKTLDDIFKSFINSAKLQYTGMVDIGVLFYTISRLLRPVPVEIICGICNISNETLQSICVECHFGVFVENGELSFKDEDFEEYLRLNYSEDNRFAKDLANYMYEKRNSIAYCARFAHIYLNEDNQFERLVEIALDEEIDGATVGVAQSNKVMLERIHMVLSRPEMKEENNRLILLKLIYRQVDFSAGEDILSNFLCNAPEEISLFCDELSIYSSIVECGNDFDSLGRKAYLLSNALSENEKAVDSINLYMNNLYDYYEMEEEKRPFERPDKDSIVRIAMAMFKVGNIHGAYNLLTGWEPKKAGIQYVSLFFKNMLVYGKNSDLQELLKIRWSLPNMLSILCAYLEQGKDLPEQFVEIIDRSFDRINIIPLDKFSFQNVLEYFEYKVIIGESKKVCRWIDKFIKKPVIKSDISFYNEDKKKEMDRCFRYYALKSICNKQLIALDTFMVENPKKTKDYDHKSSNKENLSLLYQFYLFRINGTVGKDDEIITCIQNTYHKLDMYRYRVAMNIENQHVYEWLGLTYLEGICFYKSIARVELFNYVKTFFEKGNWSTQFLIKSMNMFSKRKNMYNECVYVAKQIDDFIIEYPENAEAMVDTYRQCTKAVLQFDLSLGKEFFKKAVMATREADIYTYRKVDMFFNIITNSDVREQKSAEINAYKLAAICENYLRRIGDTKNFSYENAISACAYLDERGIWSTICRMDDRNQYDRLGIQETLPIVLENLLSNKKIDLWQAVSLALMLLPDEEQAYYNLIKQILDGLRGEKLIQKRKILEFIIDDILYNVPMHDKKRFFECLMGYLDKSPGDPELNIKEFMVVDNYIKQKTIQQYGDREDYDNSKIIDKKDKIKEKLHNVTDGTYISALEEILNQISDINGKYSVYQLGSIADFLDEMEYDLEINNWRRDAEVRKKYFVKLIGNVIQKHWDNSVPEQFIRAFKFTDDERFEYMLEYIKLNELQNADDLIQIIIFLVNGFNPKENYELLEWIIKNEWDKCCKSYSSSDESYMEDVLDETRDNSVDYYIAAFLWRMLGHPDKRYRFQAQHVLWRYCEFHSSEIIQYLLDLYNSENISKLYLNNGNYFFVESAQISFLEASLYFAEKSPEIIKNFYSFYEAIASNDTVQHALKRHLAIKVCEKVKAKCDVTEKVSLVDCEKCLIENKQKLYRYNREQDSEKKLVFSIDTTDTTRYWYDDVAELFGCTQGYVAELCDFYISSNLNITNAMVKDWQNQYYKQQYYGRAYNDHGAIPSFETLRKYAEWHSMFYAADYLRRNSTIVDDDDLDYASWLDSFLPGKDGIWGYEMRSYPPLLNVLWNSDFLSSKKDNDGYHIPKHFVEDFMNNGTEVLLGLENYNTEDRCSKNIILKSVVLEENRLADFVRELQIDSYAIYDYLYREEEWGEEKAFCVYSTCYDMGSFPDKSSDMKDPFAKGHFDLLNCNMCLSPSLFPEVGILSLKDLCARNNKSDKYHTYKWCEPVTESGYEKRGTYGYMVSINKEYLLSVLQKRSFDLVCKIQVEIEDEYSSYKSKQDKIKQEALWIMHKNGDIQVILLKEEKK